MLWASTSFLGAVTPISAARNESRTSAGSTVPSVPSSTTNERRRHGALAAGRVADRGVTRRRPCRLWRSSARFKDGTDGADRRRWNLGFRQDLV